MDTGVAELLPTILVQAPATVVIEQTIDFDMTSNGVGECLDKFFPDATGRDQVLFKENKLLRRIDGSQHGGKIRFTVDKQFEGIRLADRKDIFISPGHNGLCLNSLYHEVLVNDLECQFAG